MSTAQTKARPSKSSLIDASIEMTREGTFPMISRVVAVVTLEGCFVLWVPWFLSLTFIRYILGGAEI